MNEFENIKKIIRSGQYRALQAVNFYLLQVYWQVGGYIFYQSEHKNWGDKVVDELSQWLKADDGSLKGFDRRSLYQMKSFYEIRSDAEIRELRSLTPAMAAIYETRLPDKKLLQQKIHELSESGYFGFTEN